MEQQKKIIPITLVILLAVCCLTGCQNEESKKNDFISHETNAAFPVVHTIDGAVGFRLEWKGLSIAYVSDSEISTFEVEQCKEVDVLIHEVMPSAEEFAKGNNMTIEDARSVIGVHTTLSKLGYYFGLTNPRLGVGTHFKLGDDTNDALFLGLRKTYQGPFLLAQDLSTINVTPDYIVMRQAKINLLADPPPAKP